MRQLSVFGVRRSGQHAVINWLVQQSSSVLFLNDVTGEKYQRILKEIGLDPAVLVARRCALMRGQEPFEMVLEGHEDEFFTEGFLILRDPYNMLASRLGCDRPMLPPQEAMEVWKQHARAFDEDRDISFNRWVSDRSYRAQIAERFAIQFTDDGYNSVASWGGGSSFDRLEYEGRASEMNVLGRYCGLLYSSEFWSYLDDEVRELANLRFGIRLPKVFL